MIRGNPNPARTLSLQRTAALGDALCATVVADRLIDLGWSVEYVSHPHCHCLLRLHPRLASVRAPGGPVAINLDGAYEQDPTRRRKHFHEMFFAAAQRQVTRLGIQLGAPRNCRPQLCLPPSRSAAAAARLSAYPRPWVLICPRSNSYAARTVPDGIWQAAAREIKGTCFWLGMHPGPEGIVDLNCRHFDLVLDLLGAGDLLLTVDTGPLHVAAAFNKPCVVINQSSFAEHHLNDQNDFETIQPDLDCLDCQKNLCPKSTHLPPCQQMPVDRIVSAANARTSLLARESVSAVVAIYQPEIQTLNRCLAAVLPQVDEVVVTAEGNSIVPKGMIADPKLRVVQTPRRAIGYGRNANFGARHTRGKYLLLLNDDVFLDPEAVGHLVSEARAGAAAVGHLLRYPSGQIYHAGKVRSPGVRGWGHIDHRQYHPSWKEAQDVENLCGASVLVTRDYFYRIGGFDEDYFIYAEDDDFMLRLRRAGGRLRYTPHATGIHLEGQSTRKLGQPNEHIQHGNAVFHRKWGAYLDWNLQRVPGNFDYLWQ